MSDLISRDAAYDEIIWNSDNGLIDAKVAIEALRKLPSVEPERKKGEWIGEQPWCLPRCSICGASSFGQHGFDAIKTPYCPNCGAKMIEPQESEDKE